MRGPQSPSINSLVPAHACPAVRSPLSHAQQPSPAGTLPTELLLRIFELMPMMYAGEVREDLVAWTVTSTCADLPNVARVCRGWRAAAQISLFHSVSLVRRKQVLGFIEAAKLRPDLADRVTAMHIGLVRGTAEHLEPYEQQVELSDRFTEALSMVSNVRHLLVNHMKRGVEWRFVEVLERLPLQTLAFKMYESRPDNRDTHILTSPADVYRAYTLPSLRVFELNFSPTWPLHSDYTMSSPAPQVHSLSVTVNAPQGLPRMVSSAGSNLERLNIYTEHALEPESAMAAFKTLVNLREFRFESNIPSSAHGVAQNGWLQALLPLFRRLQRLSIAAQAASSGFLRLLPPTVEVAEYISWDRRPDAVLAALEDVLRDERLDLSLPLFVLTVDEAAYEETVEVGDLRRVTRLFAERGVRFDVRFEPMQIPQLRWVDI